MTCVYCQATGPAEHFELMNGRNHACKQGTLCTLRTMLGGQLTQGMPASDLVYVVLRLVRELAQVHWQDVEARNAAGIPGSTERRDFRPMLGEADLARLYLVLSAAGDQAHPFGDAGSAAALKQAREDYGCRRCGAIGRDECHTASGGQVPRTNGTWGPRWHAGRTL